MMAFDPDAYLASSGPANPAVAPAFDPDAYLATKPQTSQSLGFYEGLMHPFDRAAVALSKTVGAIPYVGAAIDKAGAALGMPTAEGAQEQHQQYIAQQEAKGIHPGGVGKFAGEVTATLPVAASTGPVGGGAIIGGLLSDADTVSGTVADMVKGAAFGKAADVVLRTGSAVAKPIVGYVANKIQDWTQPVEGAARDAAQYIYRLMGDSAPDDIRAAAADAGEKPILGAEAIGRPGTTALAALGRRSGTTADLLAGTLSERQAGASDRILGDYARAAGIAPEAAQGNIDAIVQSGRDAASSLYDRALSLEGPVWNADLAQLAKRPVIAKAIAASANDLRNAGKNPSAYGLDFDPVTGEFSGATAHPTAEAWDLIKKNVAGQVERDPFGKIIPDSVSRGNYNIGVANRDLTSVLRDEIPGYGDALDRAGDYLTLNKAFQTGQDFIGRANVTAAKMAEHVADLPPGELQAFKGGVANKLFDLAQNGRLSPAMFDRPIVRQKLIAALGPDDANAFLANMKIEAQLKQSGARMMPGTGSITSEILNATGEQNQSADALMDAIYAGAHLAYGNKIGFGTRMLSAMRRLGVGRTGMMPETTRNEAGRLLMMNPNDLASHLESFDAVPPSVNRVAGAINAARIPARVGASAAAVTNEAQQ